MATASSTANVAESDTLSATPVSFAPTEGQDFSGTVATFTSTFTGNVAGDFTATITWGDGATDTGTVSGSNGSFSVTAGHTYADEGPNTVTVTIADDSPSTATATAQSTIAVAEGDSLAGTGVTFAPVQGVPFTCTVATFTDTLTTNVAGDFTATIDWGDSSGTTAGTVTGSNGAFTVTGTHTYLSQGSFTVSVTLTDDAPGTATATASSTANVAKGHALVGTGVTIAPPEGQGFSGTVATFTDSDPTDVASQFTANITWGDGSSAPGTVTGGNGSFTVTGSHSYADEGSDAIVVTLTFNPTAAVGTANSTANVAEADALTATGITFAPIEGQSFSGTVATFTDTNTANVAGDFTATIVWGDGSSSPGTVSGSNGAFTVTGSHTYADEGANSVSVTLTDDAPGTATATAQSTANVAEGDVLTGTGTPIAITEGQAFSGAVATFTDTNTSNVTGDFTATIAWGDGSTSVGTVSGSNGAFTVNGSHTYTDEGSFSVSVTLTDDAPGTASTTASSTATVAEADALTGTGTPITATEGQAFTGTVASFTDTNTANVASDFTATINWGDGTTSSGTVTGSNGAFAVSATHTYADEGSFTASVTLTDDTPGTATAMASSTATVAEADVLTGTGTPVTATEGLAFNGTAVATFADTNTANMASDFTATITWGDGTSSTGTVSGSNGAFVVGGSHTYAEEGSFTIGVTLTDDLPGTATATASSKATVADAPLTITAFTPPTTFFGQSFSGVVATFKDANAKAPLSDFKATITWGDGSVSTGVVQSLGNGLFSVSASHTFSSTPTSSFSVTIKDVGGASVSASTSGPLIGLIPSYLGDLGF
jgi:hypothetical protein